MILFCYEDTRVLVDSQQLSFRGGTEYSVEDKLGEVLQALAHTKFSEAFVLRPPTSFDPGRKELRIVPPSGESETISW